MAVALCSGLDMKIIFVGSICKKVFHKGQNKKVHGLECIRLMFSS
jgi:hypothetical protein